MVSESGNVYNEDSAMQLYDSCRWAFWLRKDEISGERCYAQFDYGFYLWFYP
ncbi:MAG: hypothetical protein AAF394_14370 [Planctomycetota bacterium]